MTLQAIYEEIIKGGISADVRSKKSIDTLLKKKQEEYQSLKGSDKERFDTDTLFNPFSDTRILNGNPNARIESMMVGIDVDASELLLIEALKSKGKAIDMVLSHHPAGRAYASFYEVMDLQVDVFKDTGIALSVSENLLSERKHQVERRVSAANHERAVDAAKLLGINLLCAHTPADNLAYQYIKRIMEKEKPSQLVNIIDILCSIPEYKEAAKNSSPPKIINGNKEARTSRILVEFTGGTEGPETIYSKLSSAGIDCVIAMHQSEESFKKCREANINVVLAGHIASDNLGINLLLDHLESKGKFTIYEFSGFRRFSHKKHR